MADISKIARLLNGVSRNVDTSTNTLVVDNLKIKLGSANFVTFSGSLSGARTITVPDADVNLGHIADLNTLSGVSAGSTDLGSFSGSVINDGLTVKEALQALETAVEAAVTDTDFSDDTFRISDEGDATKKVAFQVNGLTTATTRTITMPDSNVDLGQIATNTAAISQEVSDRIAGDETTLASANSYTDAQVAQAKADILGGIPDSTLDTIKEIADALLSEESAVGAITAELGDHETRITTLEGEMDTAQADILAEVTNRNTAISTAIGQEVTDRNAAISTAVGQEAADRATADALKADRNLGNLTSPTAVNQILTPDIPATRRLGDINKSWGSVYAVRYGGTGATLDLGVVSGTSGSNQVTVTNAANLIAGGILTFYVPSLGIKFGINAVAGNVITLSGNLPSSLSAVQAYALPSATLRTENETGATPSGDANLRSGTTASGKSGQTNIQTGISTSGGQTGDILVSTGSTSGTRGKVILDGSEITVSGKEITFVANASANTSAVNKGQMDNAIASAISTHVVQAAEVVFNDSASSLGASNVQQAIDSVATIAKSAIPATQKGAANGVATLNSDGKLSASQVPSIAITSTFVVADEAAMLALTTAEEGDVAVRQDLHKSFILTSGDRTVAASWQELLSPTDAVQSVNGQQGSVVLDTDDINEGSSNLYFTEGRVLGTTLAGLNTSSPADITSGDSVISALGKLQAQLDSLITDSVVKVMVAGEALAANTSYLMRMAVSGESANRVYKADVAAGAAGSENHHYYVIGMVTTAAAVTAGEAVAVTLMGEKVLGSSSTLFSSSDIGKPVFLGASGILTVTPSSTPDDAVVRIGTVMNTDRVMIQGIQLMGIN